MTYHDQVGELLSKDEIARRINRPPRAVDEMRRKRQIPSVRFGYRTHRYNWDAVQSALQRLTIDDIS